jgi:hypothetical protein
MAFFDFLDNAWQGIGNIGADADKFMKREMPFDSGWGAPAAAVAAYFGGPAVMSYFGEGAAGVGAGEGAGALGGGGMLDSIGGAGGSFGGDLFQLGGESYTQGINPSILSSTDTNALNQLAMQNGVSQGEPSWFNNLIGNNEQGLYDQFNASPAENNGFTNQIAKQLMQTQKNQQGMQQKYQEQPVQRQPAFLPNTATINVQDKQPDLANLIKALRG